MHYVTFALLFVTWAGIAYLFLNNKKIKSYIFGNCKGPFTPKVKLINLRLKEVHLPLHLLPISLNMGTGQLAVNTWENKVLCITYLKK